MLTRARERAKREGSAFDLTLADIVIPTRCPLLGIPLAVSAGIPRPHSPSLDRKEPSGGYVRGNVWVISYRANTIKQDATLAELQALVHNLERQEWA